MRRMRILVVGAGGVGSAVAPIAARRDFFEHCVVADYDAARRRAASRKVADPRFVAARVDASLPTPSRPLLASTAITHVLNAVDPRFVMPIFDGAFAAGADYLDMAMTLSKPHPDEPYCAHRRQARRRAVRPGRRLGGRRPTRARRHGRRARPVRRLRPLRRRPSVLGDRRARRARRREPRRRRLRLRPDRSRIWTTIEECLNPPVIWEDGPRLVHDRRRSASPRCSTSRTASARSSA